MESLRSNILPTSPEVSDDLPNLSDTQIPMDKMEAVLIANNEGIWENKFGSYKQNTLYSVWHIVAAQFYQLFLLLCLRRVGSVRYENTLRGREAISGGGYFLPDQVPP